MSFLAVARRDVDPSPAEEFVVDAVTMSAIVDEQWMPLVRLATLLLNDRAAAEEVVQDACEAVWRLRPAISTHDHLVAYLRRSVINRSRSVGRRRVTAARYLRLVRAEHDAPADTELLRHEDHREVRDALARLTKRQREVLVLRYWSRLSEDEIAHTLAVSAGTVKSTAHHALAALRAHLKGSS